MLQHQTKGTTITYSFSFPTGDGSNELWRIKNIITCDWIYFLMDFWSLSLLGSTIVEHTVKYFRCLWDFSFLQVSNLIISSLWDNFDWLSSYIIGDFCVSPDKKRALFPILVDRASKIFPGWLHGLYRIFQQ